MSIAVWLGLLLCCLLAAAWITACWRHSFRYSTSSLSTWCARLIGIVLAPTALLLSLLARTVSTTEERPLLGTVVLTGGIVVAAAIYALVAWHRLVVQPRGRTEASIAYMEAQFTNQAGEC